MKLEICVENLQSAIAAEEGGADRIELCQALVTGGLTPSLGLITTVKEMLKIPVFVLIRPRPGNFVYTDLELQIMVKDILSANPIVDGFVTGALRADGGIDKEACSILIKAANGLPVTFHRAFDLSMSNESLEAIIDLGFKRILTSGGCKTALEGMLPIKKLVEEAGSRICIMPGSGIAPSNLREILKTTEAVEYHASGQRKNPVVDPNSEIVQGTSFYPATSAHIVKQLRNILKA